MADGLPVGFLERLEARGVSRRDFLRVCTIAAGVVGMPSIAVASLSKAVASPRRPPVIWLHLQECTGCTESLLRTSHPALAEVLLDLISLDYHETLSAAAGHQAEAALRASVAENAGKYVLIVEGAVPLKDGGVYCKVGGRTAIAILEELAPKAAAVIAIGSCASFGGIAAADPNPTGAVGVPQALRSDKVVTLPGCPANPYNLLGTVLQFVAFGTLPALDALGRPKHAYARTIHEDCPRRPHFDAGRFAERFGDEGHRQGYCLYRLGCKGPHTHASCSLMHFGEVVGAWPIGIGHPCVGCTEQPVAFRVAMHDTVDIARPTPPDTYAPVAPDRGVISPLATGLAGLAGGAAIGAGLVAIRRLAAEERARTVVEAEEED